MSGYIGTQPVPQSTQTRDSFTATSGQTSFATGGYQSGYIDLYLNGIKLAAADYTATNNSDVVLAVGATTGDILEVVAYTAFNTANVTGAVDFTVTNNIVVGGTVDGVDIAARDAVLTSTTTTANAALPKSGGTMTGDITRGGTVIQDGTITDTGDFTLDAAGDIVLDADGGNINFKDAGTSIFHISNDNSGDVHLESQVSDKDLYIRGNDGGSIINAVYFDMSAAGRAIFNAGATLNGSFNLNSSSYDNRQLGMDSQGFFIYNVADSAYDLKLSDSGYATLRNGLTASALNVTGEQSGDYLAKLTSTNTYGLKIKTTSTSDAHEQLGIYDYNNNLKFKVMGGGTVHATGINLGGSGAANRMDDYEIGTFSGTTTFSTYTAYPGNCLYTKIGDLVHIQMYFIAVPNTTALSIGGFPFTSDRLTTFSVGIGGGLFLESFGRLDNGTTNVVGILNGTSGSSQEFYLSCTYRAV